jgi:hypothetical protein
MIKKLFFVLLVFVPSSAFASVCDDLKRQFDFSNRSIAEINADGIVDNSAPREASRQAKISNHKLDQLMILEFMKAHKCPFDAKLGGSVLYALQALECELEKTKGNFKSEKCNTLAWVPISTQEEQDD